jgi:hypothetical protein
VTCKEIRRIRRIRNGLQFFFFFFYFFSDQKSNRNTSPFPFNRSRDTVKIPSPSHLSPSASASASEPPEKTAAERVILTEGTNKYQREEGGITYIQTLVKIKPHQL